jgi:hypothetical protein
MLAYSDGAPFATSKTKYVDQIAGYPGTRIWILVRFDELPASFAVVDTGAPYCVLNKEQANANNPSYRKGATETTKLLVRGELLPGVLIRLPVTLCAETGFDIEVQGTVFVPDEDTNLPDFIGLEGLLNRIRFAVDPSKYLFLFGPG